MPDDVFRLGVASGDPTADAVVLWTRLAPAPTEGGGMPDRLVEVRWEIADDERFIRFRQRGVAVADPRLGHSVHVEVVGLDPDSVVLLPVPARRRRVAGRVAPAPLPPLPSASTG